MSEVSAIDRTLIAALQGQRWEETLDELLESRALTPDERSRVREAASVTERYTAAVADERDRVLALLRSAGVDAVAGPAPPDVQGSITVLIDRVAFEPAIATLAESGFLFQHDLADGAMKAYPRAFGQAVLFQSTGPVTRLRLRWGPAGERGRVARVLNPSPLDFDTVALPETLWWAYWLVRPVRLLLDRVRAKSVRPTSTGPLPTPPEVVAALLGLIDPKPGDLVVDLGCGDGRVLVAAAQQFGCRGLGIDTDPRMVRAAHLSVQAAGLSEQVSIRHGDAADLDVSNAQIVFVFLPIEAVEKLLPGVLSQLGPGSRVVAHERSPVDWEHRPSDTHLVLASAGVTVAHVWWVGLGGDEDQ